MVNVIGVRFENAGKLYFFNPGAFWPTPGDFVIVETARGVEFGEVVTGVREIDDEKLNSPLKQVLRIASEDDIRHHHANKAAEKEAFAICQKKIADHKLDMKLVSVTYTFDNKTILFYFTANGRVDFRSLVKDLAGVFKTRIELRQIGVRDEAKMIGGLGPCGRPICCGTFLGDFQPVSIKMAKEQNLSLNPIKISGVCGRLMCCLKYEQDTYEEIRKTMPKEGKEVMTPDGVGVVCELKIITESVKVRMKKGDSFEIKEYPVADIQRITPQNTVHTEKQPQDVYDLQSEEAQEALKNRERAPKMERNKCEENSQGNQNGQTEMEEQAKQENQAKPAQQENQVKQENQAKPAKQENQTQPAKQENQAKPAKQENQAKPAKQENQAKPAKQENQTQPAKQENQTQPAKQENQAKPAKQENQAKPVSPWKMAVEQALRAAEGISDDVIIEEKHEEKVMEEAATNNFAEIVILQDDQDDTI